MHLSPAVSNRARSAALKGGLATIVCARLRHAGIWARRGCIVLLTLVILASAHAAAPPVISEILFNPPGTDTPNEYIELRGTPNAALPGGTYLVSLEGDAGNNPGTIQNLVDLSGRSFGGNGFLVLLQKSSPYRPSPYAKTYVQTGDDPGWGHAGGSSLKHRGESGQTDLENASCSFVLLQSPEALSVEDDLDANNDGILDGDATSLWQILDAVGVLDVDGAGDIAYGRINFRRSQAPGNAATAFGILVPVGFTPSYVGRANGSNGYLASDWIASEIPSSTIPSNFTLGDASRTAPSAIAGQPLSHLGSPNFGSMPPPGVVVIGPTNSQSLMESGETNQYAIAITTKPEDEVPIEITADQGLEISTDLGLSFGNVRTLRFRQAGSQTVWVRTVENSTVEPSPRSLFLRHRIGSNADPSYTDAIVPPVSLSILDNDSLLLSEICANPIGEDGLNEFIEIRGQPNALLRGVKLLVIDTEEASDPGTVLLQVTLDGVRLGANGLLILVAPGHPYQLPAETSVVEVDDFTQPEGALPNDSLSLLLIATPSKIDAGEDLDAGNNGILEGLSRNSTVLDSLAWLDGHTGDIAYGTLLDNSDKLHPDAATRLPGVPIPNSSSAWYFGDLKEGGQPALRYERGTSSPNTPNGALLTPGERNNSLPSISEIAPLCGAIGDPTNPTVTFQISDPETSSDLLRVSVSSTNQSVLPDTSIQPENLGAGAWRLRLAPLGVGYTLITVRVTDGQHASESSFLYAASAGEAIDTRFLIGAGDGSTAIPLPGDLILVGDDENQTLRLYNRTRSGLPLTRYPMTPFLGLTDIEAGTPREVDIEGSTRVGDRLFWMGAHSHANIAEQRTNRSRIFATDLRWEPTGPQLTYIGRYDFLKLDMVAWDNRNLHGKGARYYGLQDSTESGMDPKEVSGAGFNLEGLAMAPGSTEVAYIACRAPLASPERRTHALILPVLNFATLAASDAPPGTARFGEPIELDLFDRGIRSIEGIGDHYLLIAGPPGPTPTHYPHDFRLYTWTGRPQDPPELRTAALSGLNPEGIVDLPPLPWTPSTRFQILTDSGTRIYYGDGIITKLLPEANFKKSRLDWIPLGEITKPEPIFRSISVEGNTLRLTWRGLAGEPYRIQFSDILQPAIWKNHPGGPLRATGPIATTLIPLPATLSRYYRVVNE